MFANDREPSSEVAVLSWRDEREETISLRATRFSSWPSPVTATEVGLEDVEPIATTGDCREEDCREEDLVLIATCFVGDT